MMSRAGINALVRLQHPANYSRLMTRKLANNKVKENKNAAHIL